MRLLQRLFGATRDAIALPNFDGSRAVNLSASMLCECIERGSAAPEGPNRGRLAKPFARGYLFGFSDACIQRFGVFDELEALALITVIHGKIFGHKIGPLLVHDALRDQGNTEFGRGRTAGAGDLLRWLANRSCAPMLLTEYLRADHEPSSRLPSPDKPPAETDIEPTKNPSKDVPSRWNTALLQQKAIVEITPDKSALVIRLRTSQKTNKPIEH